MSEGTRIMFVDAARLGRKQLRAELLFPGEADGQGMDMKLSSVRTGWERGPACGHVSWTLLKSPRESVGSVLNSSQQPSLTAEEAGSILDQGGKECLPLLSTVSLHRDLCLVLAHWYKMGTDKLGRDTPGWSGAGVLAL